MNDISKFIQLDYPIQTKKALYELANGKRTNKVAKKKGNANITWQSTEGKEVKHIWEMLYTFINPVL